MWAKEELLGPSARCARPARPAHLARGACGARLAPAVMPPRAKDSRAPSVSEISRFDGKMRRLRQKIQQKDFAEMCGPDIDKVLTMLGRENSISKTCAFALLYNAVAVVCAGTNIQGCWKSRFIQRYALARAPRRVRARARRRSLSALSFACTDALVTRLGGIRS